MKALIILLVAIFIGGFLISLGLCLLSGDSEAGTPVAQATGHLIALLLRVIIFLLVIQFIVGLFR